MKTFAIAVLAATAVAKHGIEAREDQDLSFASESNGLLDSFKLWNCATCFAAFGSLDAALRSDALQGGIEKAATSICEALPMVKDRYEFCPSMMHQQAGTLFDALTKTILTQRHMCNEVLGVCNHVKVEELDLHDVVNTILSTKPVSLADDDFVEKMYGQIRSDSGEREILRAVHISDVHLDTKYVAGSNAACDGYLCCREGCGTPEEGNEAGEWGSGKGPRCDLPAKTFQNMMEFVVSDVAPDMLFWTGDNSSHNTWDNTVEEVTNYTKEVTDMIKEAIKDTDITVLPIHGNHDTWPVDEQDFTSPNANYAINHIKDYWSDWLSQDALDKYGEYGYYSMELELKNGKTLPANSRLIAINTNAADGLNFYIWGERSDPGHQFAWLEQQLLEVEANNGLAIMLGHYTPSDCQHQFGVRYRALMDRFQNVVRFGLAGHTHLETYQIHNSMTTEKPILVTSVGGSMTTYNHMNPSFRVIDIDAATMLPVNIHTYYIDVEEANASGSPDWRILHDYKDSYSMNDLSPAAFKDLAVRILTEKELAQTFLNNEYRYNKNVEQEVSQLAIYCDLATSEQHEKNECLHTAGLSAYGTDFKLLSKDIIWATVDRILGDWVSYHLSGEVTQE